MASEYKPTAYAVFKPKPMKIRYYVAFDIASVFSVCSINQRFQWLSFCKYLFYQ